MLVSRDLKRNPQVVLGACFSSFCEWYLGFSGAKDDHGRARDQTDFLCAMMSVFFLCSPFFARVDADTKAFSRKNRSKNGIPPGIRRRAGPFSDHDQYRHPYRCSTAAIRCCFRPSPLRPPDLAKLVRAAIYSREPGSIIFDVPVGLGA